MEVSIKLECYGIPDYSDSGWKERKRIARSASFKSSLSDRDFRKMQNSSRLTKSGIYKSK